MLLMWFTSQSQYLSFGHQVQNVFILATERDSFVEQVKDIIEKADEMLNEDVSAEPEGEQEVESMQIKDGYYPESQVRKPYLFTNFYLPISH